MSAWIAGVNQMAAAGLAALLNTLWYGGAVVLLTWAGLRCWPRVNAATRYWIWTAVLASLIVLPFLPGLVKQARSALEARPQATTATAPLASVPAPPVSIRQSVPVTLTVDAGPASRPWPLWLMAAWIVAAAWQMMRLVKGVVSVRRLKGRAPAVPRDALPVRLSRQVQLLASAEVASPVAVGYLHPAIVVPPKLLERLEEGERQNVLLHEVAHLARYDDWLALITQTVGAVLVFYPLASIVLGRIESEREMACDDFVVTRTGSARNYARSLARLHDLRWSTGTRLLAPGILGRKSSLGDRIESLLRRGRTFSARASLASLGVSAFLLAMLLGAGGFVPSWLAIAQTVIAWPQSFEVASIKLAKPGGRGFGLRGTWGKLWATGALDDLITYAYHIEPKQLEGVPSWARRRRYTIEAEAPPELATDIAIARKLPPELRKQASLAERQSELQMVRSLLADRFKLRVHDQIKQLPVYELMPAKGGSKLRPENAADFIAVHRKPDSGSHMDGTRGQISALGVSMSTLARDLSRRLGRTVIDKTGLAGGYDFTLKWDPATVRLNAMNSGVGQPSPASNEPSGPSIFTAVEQQLGLKLKAAKGPVEVLVVDHIEPPTPN